MVAEKTQDIEAQNLVLEDLTTNLEIKVTERTKDLELSNKIIENAHENIKDSIEFASLIQNAILPDAQSILPHYGNDYFIFWQPRDVVGGDIYFIVELQPSEEILIMIFDGAGHGVPGAFVTMLVKAIEIQVTAELKAGTLEPSPAKILAYFNRSLKIMLKQEKRDRSKTRQSNAGFDGGILYYNKKTKVCKYTGAKTPLYIINDGKLNIIKSDRKNVGFIRSKIDQEFTEYDIELKENTQLYICTDGIIDQEGINHTRYNQEKFEQLLLSNSKLTLAQQKQKIIQEFDHFKANAEQSDDVTVAGFKFF